MVSIMRSFLLTCLNIMEYQKEETWPYWIWKMHVEVEEFSKILMKWRCYHCCLYSKQVPYQEDEEEGSWRNMELQITISESSKYVWLYLLKTCSDASRRKLDDKSEHMILAWYHKTGVYRLFIPINEKIVMNWYIVIDKIMSGIDIMVMQLTSIWWVMASMKKLMKLKSNKVLIF